VGSLWPLLLPLVASSVTEFFFAVPCHIVAAYSQCGKGVISLTVMFVIGAKKLDSMCIYVLLCWPKHSNIPVVFRIPFEFQSCFLLIRDFCVAFFVIGAYTSNS